MSTRHAPRASHSLLQSIPYEHYGDSESGQLSPHSSRNTHTSLFAEELPPNDFPSMFYGSASHRPSNGSSHLNDINNSLETGHYPKTYKGYSGAKQRNDYYPKNNSSIEPNSFTFSVSKDYIFVDNKLDLEFVREKLETVSIFSFHWKTYVLVISTRNENIIIDTVKLHGMLYILNSPFANPNILKVLYDNHCNNIPSLFSTIGIKIINTSNIASKWNYSKHLYDIIYSICNVNVNDFHVNDQDWARRPLPAELCTLAQQEAHYILSIFDRLEHQKHNNVNVISFALNNSEGNMYTSSNTRNETTRAVDARQYLKEELIKWRESVYADYQDFSLSDSSIKHIVTVLPQTESHLLACCDPSSVQFVSNNVHRLLSLIARYKAQDGSSDGNDLSANQLFKTAEWTKKPNASIMEDQIDDYLNEDDSAIDEIAVPNSMEEIYQLSNANKRRNKEKKKLKEDSMKSPNHDSEDTVEPIKEPDESRKNITNTQDFMKQIGWLIDENSVRSHRRTKSGSEDKKLKRRKKKPSSGTYPPKGSIVRVSQGSNPPHTGIVFSKKSHSARETTNGTNSSASSGPGSSLGLPIKRKSPRTTWK